MSRTPGRRSTPPRRPSAAEPRATPSGVHGARVRRWAAAAGIGAAAVAVLSFVVHSRNAASHARVMTAADSLAQMSTVESWRRGAWVALQDRHVESLPYLRRAASDPQAPYEVHLGLSMELHNASYAGRVRGAIAGHATRSSAERVAVVMESLRESAIAESLAPTPHLRAYIADQRGRTLLVWGFPVDAATEYRHALAVDPTYIQASQDLEVSRMLLDQGFEGPIPGYPGNARRAPVKHAGR